MVLKQPVSNNIFAGFYERERERERVRGLLGMKLRLEL